MQICHPEVMAEAPDTDGMDNEARKRGRKSRKQSAKEMVRNMKKPLSEIQCTISFHVPSAYLEALNRASSR